MYHLRDYNDKLLLGHKAFPDGENNLERAIVEGLEATTHLSLGTNPNNEAVFRSLLGTDPGIRDLIVNFNKSLPPSERAKFGRPNVTIAIPNHLVETAGAVSAYYSRHTDQLNQFIMTTRKRYMESRNTPDRLAKHKELLDKYLDNDAKLPAWFFIPDEYLPEGKAPKYQRSFNPALQFFLEYFFEPAQFIGREDPHYFGMMNTQYGRRGQIAKLICNQNFTFSIPCESVLRYMIENAPSKRIAEIGAGSGYWARLLTHHCGDVVANDNNSEGVARYFPVICMDAEKWVKNNNGFPDRAVFFCWPRGECLANESVCMPERCLPLLKTKNLFFVGETDNGCTFDMDAWVDKHPEHRWKRVKVMELPNFLGTDDKFIHYKRD